MEIEYQRTLSAGDKVYISDPNGNCFDGLAYVKQIHENNKVALASVILKDTHGQVELIFIYQAATMRWVANCGWVKLFLEK